MLDTDDEVTIRQEIAGLYGVAAYRPVFTIGIVAFSLMAAAFEGIGMGFILPIIEQAQQSSEPSGLVLFFKRIYALVGVPFTLETIIVGVGVAIGIRYFASFLIGWMNAYLQQDYVRTLRQEAFQNAIDARITYFDQHGSDEILNAVITQTQYAGQAIRNVVRILELTLVTLAYLTLAFYLSPFLTVLTGIIIGVFMYGIRYALESGLSVGGRVADANEIVQETVQAGMQGIRDVKLLGLSQNYIERFDRAMDRFVNARVTQNRNSVAITNFNRFSIAVTVFGLIYVGLTFTTLSLGSLGLFLFAMYRIGPKASNLNDQLYRAESSLPHLVRTQRFIERLETYAEPSGGGRSIEDVEQIAFEDVSFTYETAEVAALEDVSFSFDIGEFVGFVGPSGAGKSTIVGLLARLYEPTSGQIIVNGISLPEIDLREWRSRMAVVRQDPYIFNETLRFNITAGKPSASTVDVETVAEIAQVTEFLDDLPQGYDTTLGDEGVKLSGGQRQRVAIARALLQEADVLILDEATSDLDSHLEQDVHRAIETMNRDYAIFAIAHRLSTITGANRIYMMDDGEIVEEGSHRELLEHDGAYADLYATQTEIPTT